MFVFYVDLYHCWFSDMSYLCCHSPVLQHVTLMVCFKTGFLQYALPCVLYPQRLLSAAEKKSDMKLYFGLYRTLAHADFKFLQWIKTTATPNCVERFQFSWNLSQWTETEECWASPIKYVNTCVIKCDVVHYVQFRYLCEVCTPHCIDSALSVFSNALLEAASLMKRTVFVNATFSDNSRWSEDSCRLPCPGDSYHQSKD